MSCYVGIDIGAVSATAALLVRGGNSAPADYANFRLLRQLEKSQGVVYLSDYQRIKGKPLAAATQLLDEIIAILGPDAVSGICLTGSASKLVADKLGTRSVNEFKAIAAGLSAAGIDVRTVFEMGGETSKYLRLSRNADGSFGIVDYATNGDCAAGTGSFIDQQAGRLRYAVEDIGRICLDAHRAAQVAGRCSVFAKSDMIHAQQKGYTPAETLRGLCNAVARNFRMAVVRSHPVEAPVAFIGGMAANAAVVRAMREAFDLDESRMIVPEGFAYMPAVGAAVLASQERGATLSRLSDLREASDSAHGVFPTAAPLNMDRVICLRDREEAGEISYGDERTDVFLGIDIGSVSTNVVAIDDDGRMVTEYYVRTQGRPIEVVSECLRDMEKRLGEKLRIRGVGATGSGRELIGQLVGADTINDEITAHKTGATFIGQKMLDGRVPDTIFEIGGQDSKFISLEDGVVVDFTMNEACAAGTGSFLEERAEELDISIKGEFAEMALSSRAPIRLGERCTVFMERDVNNYLQRGADKADLVAGLAYSVAYNYINRVVRGRKIGDCIFFQGGTAYNDAVAAAFAGVTGKEIIVPPHNGVIGAIGAALLARDKMADEPAAAEKSVGGNGDRTLGRYISEIENQRKDPRSRFRGYDLSRVNYTLREFNCQSCSNSCCVQEFNVEGEKTYWGDKCSDRFRKRAVSEQKPVISDLFSLRRKLLLDESLLGEPKNGAKTVGIPMTMFAWESLPFWRTLLNECGFNTVLSNPTNKPIVQAGQDTAVAEPCFPIIVAHGHLVELARREDVDYIFAPNLLSNETRWMQNESHLCPWHQTLPFVCRQAPSLRDSAGKFLTPTVRFRQGRDSVKKHLQKFFADLGVSRGVVSRAVDLAFEAQDVFRERMHVAGAEALRTLRKTGAPGIVLVGRPYNVHDDGVNLSVARKLRDYYGVNCIPLDCLDVNDRDIRNVNENMFWDLGRRIIAAAQLVGENPNLHIIYITNFKCGPDSFIKHYIRSASGKPFLTLQFDGHSNDAGMITRCEAYLDSKGILRPWRKEPVAEQVSG
jgi:predicted CoA-substrate-specific enzyme activase